VPPVLDYCILISPIAFRVSIQLLTYTPEIQMNHIRKSRWGRIGSSMLVAVWQERDGNQSHEKEWAHKAISEHQGFDRIGAAISAQNPLRVELCSIRQ